MFNVNKVSQTCGPSTANASEAGLAPAVEERDAQIVEQSESVIDNGQNGKVVAEAEEGENGVMNDDVSDQVVIYGEVASVNIDTSKGEEIKSILIYTIIQY